MKTSVTCLAGSPDYEVVSGEAGGSAAAEGQRRADRRVVDVRRKHGDHAAVVAEAMATRDAEATWGKGSRGESRLAAFVARLWKSQAPASHCGEIRCQR